MNLKIIMISIKKAIHRIAYHMIPFIENAGKHKLTTMAESISVLPVASGGAAGSDRRGGPEGAEDSTGV